VAHHQRERAVVRPLMPSTRRRRAPSGIPVLRAEQARATSSRQAGYDLILERVVEF
jgi:hypothetical protein